MSANIQANPVAAQLLQQHILEHIRIKAEEVVEADLFKEYGVDPDNMVSDIQKEGMVAIKIAEFTEEVKRLQGELSGQGPDPVVALKEQELKLKAQNNQMDNQIAAQKLEIDKQKIAQTEKASQDTVTRRHCTTKSTSCTTKN